MQKITANVLCHNDLVYLKSMLPIIWEMVDEIVLVDDFSDDGTEEYIKTFDSKIKYVKHKFNNDFSEQRNVALKSSDVDSWIFRIDSDEAPTMPLVYGFRNAIGEAEKDKVDRLWMNIYHLVSLNECKEQRGLEMRVFKNYKDAIWLDKSHEILHCSFPGETKRFERHYGLVHFKYMDKKKMAVLKEKYIQDGLYHPDDVVRRMAIKSIPIPPYLRFPINGKLERYLCSD